MAPPIRVLVVDDSAAVRRILSHQLNKEPSLFVVGTARNGRVALDEIVRLKPDAVTLDIEMPIMDGLTAVVEIRKRWPKLPVIMLSTLTEHGADATLEALSRGASEYVTKPSHLDSTSGAMDKLRGRLARRSEALVRASAATGLVAPDCKALAPVSRMRRTQAPFEILAIASSVGGPDALAKIIPMIPKDFPLPIVITQHMPPVFTARLAVRLDEKSQIKVEEGRAGEKLVAGRAWVAPGKFHMVVQRCKGSLILQTNEEPPENFCRPAADVMFRSVAAVCGPATLAVVLTGMGKDAYVGAQSIRKARGTILTQDKETSVVWGMAGFVTNAGLSDQVLPLKEIIPEVSRRIEASGAWRRRKSA